MQAPQQQPKQQVSFKLPPRQPTAASTVAENVTPSTIIPPEQRGRWFKFFFSPTTYRVTRAIGSVFIITYFIAYSNLGEGTIVDDVRKWGNQKIDSMLSVSDEDRRRIASKQQLQQRVQQQQQQEQQQEVKK